MKDNGAIQSCCYDSLDPNAIFDHTVDRADKARAEEDQGVRDWGTTRVSGPPPTSGRRITAEW